MNGKKERKKIRKKIVKRKRKESHGPVLDRPSTCTLGRALGLDVLGLVAQAQFFFFKKKTKKPQLINLEHFCIYNLPYTINTWRNRNAESLVKKWGNSEIERDSIEASTPPSVHQQPTHVFQSVTLFNTRAHTAATFQLFFFFFSICFSPCFFPISFC